MQHMVGSEKRGIQWIGKKTLKDLDFADDLCLMSYNSEDLQDKTNKLVEEAASEDRTSSEHRKDGVDEDNQPTTATTSSNRD